MKPDDDDRILDIDEAAQRAGVSRSGFYRHLGGLAYHRIPGTNKRGVSLNELNQRLSESAWHDGGKEYQTAAPPAGDNRQTYIDLQVGEELDPEAVANSTRGALRCIRIVPAPQMTATVPLPLASSIPSRREVVINNNTQELVRIVAFEGETIEGNGQRQPEITTRARKITLMPMLSSSQEDSPDFWAMTTIGDDFS